MPVIELSRRGFDDERVILMANGGGLVGAVFPIVMWGGGPRVVGPGADTEGTGVTRMKCQYMRGVPGYTRVPSSIGSTLQDPAFVVSLF